MHGITIILYPIIALYIQYEALEYVIIRNYEKVDEIKEYKLYFDKDFQTIKLK